MESFRAHFPESLDNALDLMASAEDMLLWGGGTASSILMKQGLVAPADIISLEKLAELAGIVIREDGSVRLGAMVTLREVERSALLAKSLPCLPETASAIANVRVRNIATLGGHLVHADSAQDLPPLLMTLDASVRLLSRQGERLVPMDRFFIDMMETVIRSDEILIEVIIPKEATSRRTRYAKFCPGSQDDYGTVGVAGSLTLDDGANVRAARIAVGGAGPTAMRVRDAEKLLIGRQLIDDVINDAAQCVFEQVEPWDDARGSELYKRAMSSLWTKRVLLSLRAAAAPRDGEGG